MARDWRKSDIWRVGGFWLDGRDGEGYQRVGRNKEGHICVARDWQREISGEKGGFDKMGEIERDFWRERERDLFKLCS